MNATASSNSDLLKQLLGMPPDQRMPALRAATDAPETLVVALGDEAERLAWVEVSQALDATAMVVALADGLGANRGRIRARRARGQALAYAGRFEDALAVCREGAALGDETNEQVEGARVRLASLHALGELGRLDEAVEIGETAREMLIDAGQPELAGRADFNLGVIHQNRDDPTRALFHFDRAREALTNDPALSGFVENNRGEALLVLNDFSAAEQAFKAALRVADEQGAKVIGAIAEGNLADLATRRGVLHDALYHFERARQRFESDAVDSHLARLTAEQAEALETLGLPEDALRVYQEALPQLEQLGLANDAARARAGLGKTLLRLNRTREATDVLKDAAEAYTAVQQDAARARVDLLRAQLAIDAGDYTTAATLLDGAEPALADRPADKAQLNYHRARMALLSRDYTTAQTLLDEALRAARRLDIAPLIADLLHLRGVLRGQLGDVDAGVADLREAVTQVERIRGSLQADRFRAAFLGDRLAIFEDLVRLKLERQSPDAPAEAFAAVERAKSRSLLEMTKGILSSAVTAAGRQDGDDKLVARIADVQSQLNALYSRLDQTGGGSGLQVAIQRYERELQELETRAASLRGVANVFAPTVDLQAVQRLLSSERALVEYFIAGDELLAIIVTQDGVTVRRRLADRDTTAKLVERIHFQFGRALRPGAMDGPRAERLLHDARRELHRAYEQLFAPLCDAIDGAHELIIVPHGPLHWLPFHALWDGSQYLIERVAVQYVPSASLLAHLGGQMPTTQAATTSMLIVGVADERAPEIEHEARRLADALTDYQMLIGPHATAEAVTRAVGKAQAIHFACHGRFSATNPLSSGLRLSDRWLTVRDIFSLRLAADLVTLSACETGRSQVESGDELIGLLRGFFAAGATSLITTLWKVDDRLTSEMMAEFYQSRRSGTPGSNRDALRAAQLHGLSRKPHPALWAPFILVGKA